MCLYKFIRFFAKTLAVSSVKMFTWKSLVKKYVVVASESKHNYTHIQLMKGLMKVPYDLP